MATRPIKISVVADADRARKELSSFGSVLKKTLGAGLALGGVVQVAQTMKDIVTSASDAQQSLGATEAIYGRFADQVIKKSKQAASSVGLSANAYRESSNILGALFKNQGVELDRLSGKTDEHLKLAADLSAMYGGTVTDSVAALTAAYKGEFNQLEKYGVTLKQATINTEADAVAKKKYGKSLKDLTPQQESLAKQLATQQLLFKQTGDATGTFAKEADTLAGQQQRLNAELADAKAEIGTALLPLLTDLAKAARNNVVPALQDFAGWLGENKDEIQETGREIGSSLLPVLRTTGDVLGVVVDVIKAMPEPLRSLVLQAGAAALVFPKLSAAVTAVSTSSGGMIANLRDAEKRTAALSGAARQAAGIGGMVLLTQGMTSADGAAKAMLTTLGGAAAGFSFAGPAGAAVGGLGGLMVGLSDGTHRAELTARLADTTWQTYASTMDEVTGATTKATKSMIIQALQKDDLINKAADLGISSATLVKGILGQAEASGVLSDALAQEEADLKATADAYMKKYDTSIARGTDAAKAEFKAYKARLENLEALKAEVGEVKKGSAVTRERLLLLKSFPDEAITKIQTPGAVDSKRELVELAAQYDLTPKQLLTVIRMNGIKGAKDDVKGLVNTIATEAARAKTAGDSIGSNLGKGMYEGLGRWISPVATRSAGMVSAAIKSAQTAGQIQSPSRRTKWIGEMLGEGLAEGMARKTDKVQAGGKGLMDAVRDGIVGGGDGVEKALDRITKAVDKKFDGKKQKKYLKSLTDEYKALRANGRAQDAVNGRLSTARDRLKELTDEYADYARTVRDAVTATGDVTQLGRQDDGTVSIKSLIAELDQKVISAERFDVLLQKLAEQGLSETSVQQLLAAGPDAALATAEAIEVGGTAAITEINALQARLAASGDSLAGAMSAKYYGAGVDAARGIVAGIEAEAKNLDAAAVKMANALVKAVKKALKIKSPSQVFAGIGEDVIAGLDLGIDDTHVKRSGTSMAAALEKGFGRPALEAYMSHNRADAGGGVVRHEVRITAEQMSAAQRGKAIIVDITAAEAMASRRTAINGVGS